MIQVKIKALFSQTVIFPFGMKRMRSSYFFSKESRTLSVLWPFPHGCVYLEVSLMGDILQDDGLHGENVGKLHLGDVERTDNVGPP